MGTMSVEELEKVREEIRKAVIEQQLIKDRNKGYLIIMDISFNILYYRYAVTGDTQRGALKDFNSSRAKLKKMTLYGLHLQDDALIEELAKNVNNAYDDALKIFEDTLEHCSLCFCNVEIPRGCPWTFDELFRCTIAMLSKKLPKNVEEKDQW